MRPEVVRGEPTRAGRSTKLQRGRRSFTDEDGTLTLSDPEVGAAFIRTGRTVHTEEVHEDFRGLLIEFKG